MKKTTVLLPPILGAVGAALRLLQCRAAFDPQTLLSVPHFTNAVLPVFLLLCAGYFAATAGKKQAAAAFEDAFAVPGGALTAALTFAALLAIPFGALLVKEGLGGSKLTLILGAAAALSGACLYLAVFGWRKGNVSGPLFLCPVLFCLLWLFATYRDYAAWPVMQTYYLPVLSIAAAACGFYHTAGCAYGQGSRRALRFFLPTAAVLCGAALGDSLPLALKGLYLSAFCAQYALFLCLKDE